MTKPQLADMSVSDRIEYKAHHEINDLDTEEKELLQQRLVDKITVRIYHTTDEGLLEMGLEEGAIL